jgi:hypothetical protein
MASTEEITSSTGGFAQTLTLSALAFCPDFFSTSIFKAVSSVIYCIKAGRLVEVILFTLFSLILQPRFFSLCLTHPPSTKLQNYRLPDATK